jgi:hypothetical protein
LRCPRVSRRNRARRDERVEVAFLEGGYRAGGARHRFGLEALGFQEQTKRLENVGLIVGNEESRRQRGRSHTAEGIARAR